MQNHVTKKVLQNSKILHFLGVKSEIYQCTKRSTNALYAQIVARCSALTIKISIKRQFKLDLAPRKQSVLDVARVVSARDRLDRIGPTPGTVQSFNFKSSVNRDFLTKKRYLNFGPIKDLEMTMNTPMAPSLSEIALSNFKNDMNSLPVELPALNRAATQA